MGEEGAGSGIPTLVGSGRNRENFYNIVQYDAKRQEPTNTGRKPGLKGTGSGRF